MPEGSPDECPACERLKQLIHSTPAEARAALASERFEHNHPGPVPLGVTALLDFEAGARTAAAFATEPLSPPRFTPEARRLLEWIVATNGTRPPPPALVDRCREVLGFWSASDEQREHVHAALLRFEQQIAEVREHLVSLGESFHAAAEAERFEALLRRVRCYAVVDPLGNGSALAIAAERMHGIERDIDDALDGRPQSDGERFHGIANRFLHRRSIDRG